LNRYHELLVLAQQALTFEYDGHSKLIRLHDNRQAGY